ncbi:hypothetical protein GPDM_00950 [Planococcus donghaensis MPA1U2]|uniref:Uncharacterized protein n=1 Tax=Planococcus donghaensis MPA1U2 TaxID=933115 RepID=E7RCM6_9BACL|nr:hypothetical protein GPDM_00950 [Planococcus donghaensis MPA1U2]
MGIIESLTEEIQVYIIGFDVEKVSPFAKVEKIPLISRPEQTKKIEEILDCERIEIVDYSNEIAIVVSDRGMFTDGLPIFEIIAPDNTELHLAGTLLFAKNTYTAEDVEIGELNSIEIHQLVQNLKIKVIGAIRN